MADLTCTNCGAVGTVEGVAEEVVPEKVKCGYCLELFDYQTNVWDRIRKDYDGEVAAFYMRFSRPGDPKKRRSTPAPVKPADDRDPREPTLDEVPTKVLLDAFRRARIGNGVYDDAIVHVHVSGRRPTTFRGDAVRAELATRPHVPNKREARAQRRAAAQGQNCPFCKRPFKGHGGSCL